MPFQRDEITRIANAASIAQRQLDTPVFGRGLEAEGAPRIRGVTRRADFDGVLIHAVVNGGSVTLRIPQYMLEEARVMTDEQARTRFLVEDPPGNDIVSPRYLMFHDNPHQNIVNILSADGRRLLSSVPRREWISYSQGQRDELIAPLVEAEVQRALSDQTEVAPRRRWSDGIDTPNIGARRERRGRAERWNGSNWEAVDPLVPPPLQVPDEMIRMETRWVQAEQTNATIFVADARGTQTRIALPPDGMEAEDL